MADSVNAKADNVMCPQTVKTWRHSAIVSMFRFAFRNMGIARRA
jgi:hypothetical protein